MANKKLYREAVLQMLFADSDSEGEYLPFGNESVHEAQTSNHFEPLPNGDGGGRGESFPVVAVKLILVEPPLKLLYIIISIFITIFLLCPVGNFPMISADLVNSYHLLLCALDLVYCNALLCSSHKDLLNPAFKGPTHNYKPGPGSLCFIEKLCELHDGLVLEAKGAKEHFWKPFIKKLFERKLLKYFSCSLQSPRSLCFFSASLNRVYEKHVLSSGSLDERIFLGEAAREDIGTPGPCLCEGIENQERLTNPLQNSMTVCTDRYVPENSVGTPVSMAMQSVGCLHTLCRVSVFTVGVSPSPTSRHDRYSSPPTGTACRRLFVDGNSTPEPAQPVKVAQPSLVSPIPAGQTVVTMATATVTANNGQTVTIPVQGAKLSTKSSVYHQYLYESLTAACLLAVASPAAAGCVANQVLQKPNALTVCHSILNDAPFPHQVYHLASVRLRDLCAKLDISADLRRKIWTCFEYSLVHCTDLMVDRHLDQLLMCAIYVMTKVFNLLGARDFWKNSSPVSMRSSSTLPIPQPSSAPSTPTRAPGGPQEQEEERADLIRFYNHVSLFRSSQFSVDSDLYLQLCVCLQAEAPPLCPYPSLRIGSPRRVLLSHNHSIYISPHKTSSPISPRDKIFYYVSSSPSNRLREINRMIRTGETPTEKRSIALEEEQQSPAKRLCQENQTALLRRLQDVANDRSSSH
uniref:RB transcriptional corepressor like 2 n=1 Tax=Sinocyclocheilus grahami TaxID=75366 RepID=A0A672KVX3_SINGR